MQKVSAMTPFVNLEELMAAVASDGSCEPLGEPLSRVMTLLGKRWSGIILSALMQGPMRFNEIKRAVPGVSDRVLTERLGEFQALQLVSRTVTDATPLRIEYALTDRGEAMRPAITELTRWAEQNLSPDT
jgi:DNA-binding HxlR family transcriptional regulator